MVQCVEGQSSPIDIEHHRLTKNRHPFQQSNSDIPSLSYHDMSAPCMILSSWLSTLWKINAVYVKSIQDQDKLHHLNGDPIDVPLSLSLHDHEERTLEALCLLLERRFDPDKLRQFMLGSTDCNQGWRPPSFYWQLMRTPITARTLKQLCEKDRRSEFLLAFNEDLLAIESSTKRNWKLSTDKHLGRITSNFTIFARSLGEVIRDFLLEDENEEYDVINPNHFCTILCHTENSYCYSQAILHFLPRWRPDLMACRRLSQTLYRYIRDIRCDYHVARIGLRFTGLENFPELYRCFSSIQCQDYAVPIPQEDVCALSDAVTKVLTYFLQYQSLLYPRLRQNKRSCQYTTSQLETASKIRATCIDPAQIERCKRPRSVSLSHCHLGKTRSGLLPSLSVYPSDNLERDIESITGSGSVSRAYPINPVPLSNDPLYHHGPQHVSLDDTSALSSYPDSDYDEEDDENTHPLSLTPQESSDSTLSENTLSTYSSSAEKKKDESWKVNASQAVYSDASCGSDTLYTDYPASDYYKGLTVNSAHQDLDDNSSFNLPPASQSGELWKEEYDRIRYCAEHCPLHVIRDELFIDTLYRDFTDSTLVRCSLVLAKTVELFLNLTTLSAYEILTYQEEFAHIMNARSQRLKPHDRQLPGHWTTEGAYNLEDNRSVEGDIDQDNYSEPQLEHSNLDHVFNSRGSSDNMTGTVRIGLGSAKIGGLSYNQRMNTITYTSFMDGKPKDDHQDSNSLTSSPTGLSKITSNGSWIDSVWRKSSSEHIASQPPPLASFCSEQHSSPNANADRQNMEGWNSELDTSPLARSMSLNKQKNKGHHSYYAFSHVDEQHTSTESLPYQTNMFFPSVNAENRIRENNVSYCSRITSSTSIPKRSTSQPVWPAASDCTSIERALFGTPTSTVTLSEFYPSPITYVNKQKLEGLVTNTNFEYETDQISLAQVSAIESVQQCTSPGGHQTVYRDVWYSKHYECMSDHSSLDTNGSISSTANDIKHHSAYDSDDHGNRKNSLYGDLTDSESLQLVEPSLCIAAPSSGAKHFSTVSQEFSSKRSHWNGSRPESTITDQVTVMQSVMDSNIYVDPEGRRTIGLAHDSSTRRQSIHSRKRYRELHRQIEMYKERARQDVLDIYRIVHNTFLLSMEARTALLLRCTTTFLGASMTLAFIKHRIIFNNEGDTDPLLAISPTILTVFVYICQRHPKKRLDVLSLLHSCFKKSHMFFKESSVYDAVPFAVDEPKVLLKHDNHSYSTTSRYVNNSPLQQSKRRVFDFLMWLLGTGFYSGVFSFLRFHMCHVDKSLLRKQLDLILHYCRPPYSTQFVVSFLNLVHEVFYVQKTLELTQPINAQLEGRVLEFLDHVNIGWSPRQPPSDILSRISDIKGVSGSVKKKKCSR